MMVAVDANEKRGEAPSGTTISGSLLALIFWLIRGNSKRNL